jgi:hypothetical protein
VAGLAKLPTHTIKCEQKQLPALLLLSCPSCASLLEVHVQQEEPAKAGFITAGNLALQESATAPAADWRMSDGRMPAPSDAKVAGVVEHVFLAITGADAKSKPTVAAVQGGGSKLQQEQQLMRTVLQQLRLRLLTTADDGQCSTYA